MAQYGINPNKDADRMRLFNALDYSWKQLRIFRENRLWLIQQYVGQHYSGGGAENKVPLNVIELAINTYQRSISANNPRVMVSSEKRELRSTAWTISLAVNKVLERMNFVGSLRKTLVDAMFSLGIMKVGLAYCHSEDIGGEHVDMTKIFAEPVSLDDWIHDMTAKDIRYATFMSNKYELPYEFVMESKQYKNKDNLQVGGKFNAGGKDAKTITAGAAAEENGLYKLIQLRDVWLPHEKLFLTITDDSNRRPLRILEWDGPDCGPYHTLGFADVPNNSMPLAPAATWRDFADILNILFRKLKNQAERQKNIPTYEPASAEDMERLVNAEDGKSQKVKRVAGIGEMKMGGIDPANFAFMLKTYSLFSDFNGNISALAGLGPQSSTVGQDKMILESASKRVADMQDKFYEFTKEVVESIVLYILTDPYMHHEVMKKYRGANVEIPTILSALTMKGEMGDYDFEIEPYSMHHSTPATKLATINAFTQQIIPMLPALQQQGIGFDWENWAEINARYSAVPEIQDLLIFSEAPAPDPDVGDLGKMPTETTRTNVRINRPGATQQGADEALIQKMMGGNMQDSQENGMFRQTG
jgi:hypothetical protein